MIPKKNSDTLEFLNNQITRLENHLNKLLWFDEKYGKCGDNQEAIDRVKRKIEQTKQTKYEYLANRVGTM